MFRSEMPVESFTTSLASIPSFSSSDLHSVASASASASASFIYHLLSPPRIDSGIVAARVVLTTSNAVRVLPLASSIPTSTRPSSTIPSLFAKSRSSGPRSAALCCQSPNMLTFRRALIAAACFIIALYLVTQTHTSRYNVQPPIEAQEPEQGLLDEKTKTGHGSPVTTSSSENPATHKGVQNHATQQPITDMARATLRQKLEYQFPYDVETKFPAYIWQTWKYTPASGEFDEKFRPAEASWSEKHPSFVHEVITDQVAVHLMRHLYASIPEVLEAYVSLPMPVLKADFFRYLILLARGGIYSDIDTYALKSAAEWLPDNVPRQAIGLVVGIEADPDRPDWAEWYSRRIQFCQWTIQSKAGHPVLREIVANITQATLNMKAAGTLKSLKDKSVVDFTGPAVWTDTIFNFLNDERYFEMSTGTGNITWRDFTGITTSKRVGDMIVLPITSFSPGVQQMNAGDYDHPMAFELGNQSTYGTLELLPNNHPIDRQHSHLSISHLYKNSGKRRNRILTYRDLDTQSNLLALGLRERGVRKGDRVCVSLGNCWEFGVLTYAVFKLGAILVPLNPAFNGYQIISALKHLEAKHLVMGTETHLPFKAPRENISLLTGVCGSLEGAKLESLEIPSLENVILVQNSEERVSTAGLRATIPFEELMWENEEGKRAERDIVPDEELYGDEIVNIQFTSGTTSQPKAACLSHESILNNGFFIGERMGLSERDVVCCPPPLFHCFGSILGYMATATHGSAILFPSPSFNPALTLDSIPLYSATALYGVSTMFISLLSLISSSSLPLTNFSTLRTGIAAGSSVPSHLMERLHSVLNLKGLTICYGMTETSPVSCMTMPTDPIEKRIDSVGKCLPHVEAKIVSDHDRSVLMPIGERGELAISGYLVMKGYWNDPLRTSEVRVLEDGKIWMYTGDEAEMDSQGYVKITGRIKDLIIRGGENIHPLEIENVLFQMQGVGEASIVGLPDEKYGECVAAFVIVAAGWAGEGEELQNGNTNGEKILKKEDLKNWVRQTLSPHLVPKHIFWISEFPKTASGKIQKYRLRELGVGLLGKTAI
ncbi:hypothetical protein B7494_g8345 [Chlorociboria aeruginascens]|nr:hypothetical protein B7494_g8345 [Chlorociboria aeruginascens]